MSDLDILYTPAKIGRLKLKNRFIQSPLHSKFASDSGEVSPKMIDYLARRARGGVSMIILENTAINWEEGRAAGNPVRIDDDRYIAGLSDLTEVLHREGVMVATQLHHAGRQNPTSNTDGRVGPVAPSPIASTAIGDVPRELTVPQIKDVVRQFREAAVRTVSAGFDMAEIHGSHGYLITQFLSPQSNLRTDEYGGSFENRARFPLEVVKAVREAVGPDFPVSFRISLEERTEGGMDAEEGLAFCKLIEEYVDVFNVTAATYESMDSIFMMQGRKPAELLPLAAKVKAVTDKPVIGISRLGWAMEESAEAVRDGHLDFVAMARTQLADPDLVLKTKNGEAERVRRCIACDECVGTFLFGGLRVHCVMNPELGYERDAEQLLQIQPRRKHVLVVGGGPAGAEAARAAALRGHQVRLIEAKPRIGGKVLVASAAEYKKMEFEAYVVYFERELEHVGVDVRVGVAFNPDGPDTMWADTVVFATGGQPANADNDDAVTVLESGRVFDGPVTVFGGNEIGLTAAAYAAQQGQATTVVTDGEAIGFDMNPILAEHLTKLLTKAGVQFVDDEPASVGHRIVANQWLPDETEWSLDGKDVFEVGAKVKGGRLYQATQSGFWTGTRI